MLAEPGLPLTERSEPLFIGLGVGQKSTRSGRPDVPEIASRLYQVNSIACLDRWLNFTTRQPSDQHFERAVASEDPEMVHAGKDVALGRRRFSIEQLSQAFCIDRLVIFPDQNDCSCRQLSHIRPVSVTRVKRSGKTIGIRKRFGTVPEAHGLAEVYDRKSIEPTNAQCIQDSKTNDATHMDSGPTAAGRPPSESGGTWDDGTR